MITGRSFVIIHFQLSIIHSYLLLQKLREPLALALLTLLPLHALLVTVGTRLIAGPGHAPLTALALWKEGVLALILLLACIEIISHLPSHVSRPDRLDFLILLLIGLSLIISIIHYPLSISQFIFGFRYDFVPLVSFLILRRVPWSDRFMRLLPMLLLGVGALIAVYGILSFVLPAGFFAWLGYSDLHSLYVPDGPVAALQQFGSTGLRSIQCTMSGPNHLGLWLLIPVSILCASVRTQKMSRIAIAALGTLFAVALLLTFSRAAWIGAIVIVLITMLRIVPRAMYSKVFLPLTLLVVAGATFLTMLAPSIVLRLASSRDHLIRPMHAVRTMIEHPLGLGLGSAGPASNRTSDPCVFLEAGSDPSWAANRPNLCVFVDNVQVQPANRACRCPFLPENWYLQIGVELGVLGFLLFLALTLLVIRRLMDNGQGTMNNDPRIKSNHYPLSIIHYSFRKAAFLSFLAISLASLFLHAWEDMATAVTVWVLVAVTLPSGTLPPWKPLSRHNPSPCWTSEGSTPT